MWKQVARWFVLILVAGTGVLMVGNSLWNHYVGSAAADSQLVRPDYSATAATWIGRDACVACHATADSDWKGSDHDLAMQIPGPATITADFDNATFTHFDVTSTFYRDGEKYMVRTDGPDGARWTNPLNDSWKFHLRGDLGGLGLESDFTASVGTGFHWQINKLITIDLLYKATWVDFESGSRGQSGYFNYDTVTHGPIVGCIFNF